MDEVKTGHRGVFCLLVDSFLPLSSGASMWVYPDGKIEGSIGGGPMEYERVKEALDTLDKSDRIRVRTFDLGSGLNEDTCPENAVRGDNGRVYMELMEQEEEVFIFGAGHVVKALARFASLRDFKVTVWDEREQYANEENIPYGRTICCPLEELFDESVHGKLFKTNTYVVIYSVPY